MKFSRRWNTHFDSPPALVAVLLLLMPAWAFAYVDPGTGTILWQMLLGLMVGVGFYFRRIVGWFTKKQG
ncbi:MAG: hypothetical protein IT169_15185 [Bryobacterales bacterium]|nr:hypothetical protein [Bryobacterales bacterium]